MVFQSLGWIKDEVGLRVNKAILVRKVGDVDLTRKVVFSNLKPLYRERILKAHPEYKDDDIVVTKYTVPSYAVVANHYFGDSELVWEFSKSKSFYLDLENTAYVRRMTKVQFIDFESGDALPLSGFRMIPPKNPEHLRRLWTSKHVENFVAGAKEKINYIWLVVGGVVGGFFGYALSVILSGGGA